MLRTANMRSALYMSFAMFGFTFNDAFMKNLSEDMGMGQAIFLRGIFASSLIILIAYKKGALRPLRTALQPMPFLRTAGEAMATVFFLSALTQIPLANASAIIQALPLLVTVGAAVFLKEAVGWRRWTAILIGFLGVLLVIRPGAAGYTPYSLLVVAAVLCAATRDLATRALHKDTPSLFLSVLTALAVTATGLVMWVLDGSVAAVGIVQIIKIVAASLFILVGYQFIVLAVREGEIAFVVPFRYTALLWSILLGVVIFSDYPDPLTIAGSTIIVLTGIYTLYREHRSMTNI